MGFNSGFKGLILRMKHVSDKSSGESQNTHFVFNNFLPRKSCRLWDNVEKNMENADRPKMAI